MELKLFKHMHYLIKKLKGLESIKHNQPMFSNATQKLSSALNNFMETQSSKRETSNDGVGNSILGSSLSSINNTSQNSHLYNFKSKTSILSGLQKPTTAIMAKSSQGRTISIDSKERKKEKDPKRQIHVIPENKKRQKS